MYQTTIVTLTGSCAERIEKLNVLNQDGWILVSVDNGLAYLHRQVSVGLEAAKKKR